MVEADGGRRRRRLVALVAGVIGVAVYLGTLPNDFVLDDVPAIVRNPDAHWPPDLARVFTTNYWGSPRGYAHLTIYRPLATLSFAVGEALHGPAPWGLHLGNALLHGVVAALVALLALALAPRRRTALLAAGAAGLLFAVHPAHVEAVAGAVSRAELLAAAFVLALLLCADRARRPGARRGIWWAAATAAFALGLLSKESAATALLALPLLDAARWLAARREGRPAPRPAVAWPLLLACAAVLAGYVALRAAVLPAVLGGAVPPSDNPLVAATGAGRWLTPFAVYLEAWRVLVWPAALSVDYTAHALPLATSWADPRGLAGLALFAGTLALAAVWARRHPERAFALGLFLATYAVASHLAFPGTVIFAERLLYLPSAGLCLLAGLLFAAAVTALRPRALRGAAWALAALVLAAGAARTVARTTDWRDEPTLYATSLRATPRSARLHNNLGRHLLAGGDLARAVRAFQTAVRIDAENVSAWSNLARAALLAGEWEAAAAAVREALARNADFVPALDVRCALERARGRPAGGLAACRRAVTLAPDEPIVHANLVRSLAAAGQADAARAALAAFGARFPDDPERAALEALVR